LKSFRQDREASPPWWKPGRIDGVAYRHARTMALVDVARPSIIRYFDDRPGARVVYLMTDCGSCAPGHCGITPEP